MTMVEPIKLTRKDFASDQTVRWCPGCGDYGILMQIQKTMPEIGVPKENIVFISGIGCSSRFPYYMNTYGIHSIHGRAPTLASGLKITNPELSVWVITGDGDGLSIGGNHLIHACRRNMDLNIILFNNRIYGLTKGQYSPTSPLGFQSKTSPMGTIEQPLNPISVALASEATFIARTIDVLQKHMAKVLLASAHHKGASFVEIFQNCLIFNDGAFQHQSDRRERDDYNLYLENGKPMIFGKNHDKGLVIIEGELRPVILGDQYNESDLLVHNTSSIGIAWLLSRLQFPTPLGVLLDIDKSSYSDGIWEQVKLAKEQMGEGDLNQLYNMGETWTVD